MLRLHGDAFLGDLCLDPVDVVADVHTIRDGLDVRILGDEIPIEEAKRVLRGRGGEADEEGVEIFDDLPPEIVDGAVALIDDDEIEGLDGDARIVADGDLLGARSPALLVARDLVRRIVEAVVVR